MFQFLFHQHHFNSWIIASQFSFAAIPLDVHKIKVIYFNYVDMFAIRKTFILTGRHLNICSVWSEPIFLQITVFN